MEFPFCTRVSGSWLRSLTAGMLLLLVGLLLVLEPALSLTLALYSLGIVSLLVALLCLAVAALLSRGGGLPFFFPLSLGLLLLAVSIVAFVSPGILGGVIATLAGAILVLVGLGLAATAAFSAASPGRRALSILLGISFLAAGILAILDPRSVSFVAARIAGVVTAGIGLLLVAGAISAWWRERHAGPGTTDLATR
ncbi:MAG: hypothetical protein QFX32_01980 [Methanolinea sp.]|nr:hypothetical protein [Methanolinea sp.]